MTHLPIWHWTCGECGWSWSSDEQEEGTCGMCGAVTDKDGNLNQEEEDTLT